MCARYVYVSARARAQLHSPRLASTRPILLRPSLSRCSAASLLFFASPIPSHRPSTIRLSLVPSRDRCARLSASRFTERGRDSSLPRRRLLNGKTRPAAQRDASKSTRGRARGEATTSRSAARPSADSLAAVRYTTGYLDLANARGRCLWAATVPSKVDIETESGGRERRCTL